jgi:hypothetical protein
MHPIHSSRLRWIVACALALGGIALTARRSSASYEVSLGTALFVDFISSSPNCLTDASGDQYMVNASGLDASGNVVCNASAIASGVGVSAETNCTSTKAPAEVEVFIGALDESTGSMVLDTTFLCASSGAWGTELSCSRDAIVTSSCPAHNTITAVAEGVTFSK